MTRILVAGCLALFLFFASAAAEAEAPSWSAMIGRMYEAGITVGCYRAIEREREYGYNVLTSADCEAILNEYGAAGDD